MKLIPYLQSTRFLLALLAGCSVVAIIVVSAIAMGGVHHISREEDREVLEGYALLEGAYQLQLAADQEVILIRDYLLTGKSGFGEPDQVIFNEFDQELQELKRLTDDPESLRLLEEIGRIGRAYRQYSERLLGMLEADQDAAAMALFLAEGRPHRLAWIQKLEELIARQHAYVASRHDEVNRTENLVKLMVGWAAALSVPLTFLLAVVVMRRVITPLSRLETISRMVADGDFSVRVPQVRDDEFGRVAQAFNLMIDRIALGLTRLQAANQDLQRADRLKDEFLSIVSHELRTPLNFIKGFTSLMANEFAGPLTEQQRQHLENITQSTERMLLLVNDLLDVAALQAGKLRLEPESCVYGPLVEEAVQSALSLADHKHIQIETDLQANPVLHIDPRRVAQVLTNLLSNAIKFTPRDGAIHVSVTRAGDRLVTEIRDTGIGITPDDQLKLFQPFTQLDMSATRKAGGTGLGLSISKALVEAHGGEIGVRSVSGEGATFWFTLPVPPAAQVSAARD